MEREVLLPVFPLRIISLVPSQTELLFDLGLEERVVGITKFCIHPNEWYRTKSRIGGTKNVNFDKIAELKPDLIIGNKEENSKGDIEELEKHYPVWMSDIETIYDAIEMIEKVSHITNKDEKGKELIRQITTARQKVVVPEKKDKVLYFIWKNPWMVVGKRTFIDEMLAASGLENIVYQERYIELTNEEVRQLDPALVYLSSEPFPFKEEHVEELQQLLPQAKIKIVDGEMFSWCGSRMKEAFPYFNTLSF